MVRVEHVPVLYQETLAALALRSEARYIDCTAGSAGHAAGIMDGSAPHGKLLALDTDEEAIERTRDRLRPYGERARVVQGNFRDLADIASRESWDRVDGILFDLGVSSVQLGAEYRGFSFQADGPLDMRMDRSRGKSAADLVRDLSEHELADIIYRFGEEPQARRIAATIVRERARHEIDSTARLADVVSQAKGRRGRINPATTVFQALRIAVNGELESITLALPQALRLLRPGGRLAVIAFHSLEDRIVKLFMREEAKECRCPPSQPVCTCDRQPTLRLLDRHAVLPGPDEVRANPRARSARLRVAEKL